MQPIFDCHAHIVDPSFDDDRQQIIERAQSHGVTGIITIGETYEDAVKNLKLSGQYECLFPCIGLYPTILDIEQAEQIVQLIRENHHLLAGVGEVGLDFWKVKEDADREMQRHIFGMMIDIAMEYDLPLNVHSRSAGRHTIDLLLSRGAKRVQMHAFDGRYGKAIPALEAGYFFSVPPSIIRSQQKQKLIKNLPLKSLLLETDSPVLGPVSRERNEPANILISLETIAEIRQVSEEDVATAIEDNFSRLYGERIDKINQARANK
jgi:TatD DNase family protein